MGTILASEPAPIGGVLDQAFRLFRVGIAPLLPFTVTTAVANIVVRVLQSGKAIGGAAGIPALATPRAGLLLVAFVVGLGATIVQLIAYSGAIHRLAGLDSGKGTAAESWRIGARRAPALFGAGLLVVLMVGIPAGVIALIVVGAWSHLTMGGRAAVAILVLIALSGLIYLAARWLLIGQEVVLRSRSPGAAIRSSWRMTKGYFWRLMTIFLVVGLVLIALFLALGFLAGVISGTLLAAAHLPAVIAATIVAGIVSFVSIVTTPFTLGVSIAIWHDLLLRNEGGDLAERIEALPGGR